MIFRILNSIHLFQKITTVGVLALTLVACQSENFQSQIDTLEQAVAAHATPGLLDSLANTYRKAAGVKGTPAATSARYLTRAAELRRQNKDLAGAVWLLDEVLTRYTAGADVIMPVGLLAGMYGAQLSEPAAGLADDVLAKMAGHLRAHPTELDSALARANRQLIPSPGAPPAAERVSAYTDLAAGYADLLRTDNPAKAGTMLFSAASVAGQLGQHQQAIRLYTRLSEQMADHPQAPTALFLAGFIYENDLGDLNNAKMTYETFLKRYPTNPDYADDAQLALKNLGKSPEELIKEFERR
jgi:tetratricopeptide (TPR) repeat protein